MKDLILLVDYDEILNFVSNLFLTDEVKEALKDKNHYIYKMVHIFASFPRIIFTLSDEEIEKAHFTSGFNCLSLRTYGNTIKLN